MFDEDITAAVHRYVARRGASGAVARTTVANEKSLLLQFAAFVGDRPVTAVKLTDVNDWTASLTHLSPITRRTWFGTVRAFFASLVDEMEIARSPFVSVCRARPVEPLPPGPLMAEVLRYTKRRADLGIIRPGTVSNERHILCTFTAFMGNRAVAQIGTSDVERWLTSIGDLSPGTRRGRYGVVRNFFKHQVEQGKLRRNPFNGIEAPKVPRSQFRSLGADQAAAMLTACPDARARCVIILGLQLGLRRGEIAGLELGDIYWESRSLFVRQAKGGHTRTVPLTDEAREAIESYLAASPANHGPLIRGDRYPGRHVSSAFVGRLVTEIAYEAGVKLRPRDGVSAHALRHTAATDTYQNGRDVMVVRDLLGHVSLATTQIYVRGLDIERLREAVEGRRYAVSSETMPAPDGDKEGKP